MAKLFFSQLCLVLLLSSRVTHGAQGSGNHTWKPEDMTPEGVAETSTGSKKEVLIWPGKPNCGLPKCKFELYYFKGANFNAADSRRKNILYITGGPGQIVRRKPKDQPLDFLENNHNVVYFDLRGAGLSTIDGDNRYDRFLRSDYVASDIEEIRLKERGPAKAWDAIYAHSAGTIIAHKYAATYGAAKVTRLILAAPVSRQRDPEQTENAQIAMILSNLDAIYERYRSKNCLITTVMNLADFFGIRKSNDDFCFLSDTRRTVIKNNLKTMFTAFKASYGSVGFVIQNFQDLLQKDNGFKEKYRYPEAFFHAIRVLEHSGAPVEGLAFIATINDRTTKDRQVDAALLIGYYLSFDKDDPALDPRSACRTDAPFLAGIFGRFRAAWKGAYCIRIDEAKKPQQAAESLRSIRANEVFGVYDGVSRSVLGMLKQQRMLDNEFCFKGNDFIRFATNETANTSNVAREAARKIGVEPDKQFCPWNPTKAKYQHSVPTLILKGGADPVIAGCQAEDIFNDALTGQRVLIEFRGAGHSMELPIPADDTRNVIETVVNKILAVPSSEFSKIVNDSKVKAIKDHKRGDIHSANERDSNRLTCRPS